MRSPGWRVSAALLVFVAAAATAKENYKEQAFNADSKDKFAQVQDQIRDEMKPGGKYEYVKQKERFTIDQKFQEMDALFAAHDTVAAMSPQDKIALFNAQETVNSILQQRDRDRVICTKQVPIGSHIPITTCHTYAQEQDANQVTHNNLESWSRPQCGDGAGGTCGGSAPGKTAKQ